MTDTSSLRGVLQAVYVYTVILLLLIAWGCDQATTQADATETTSVTSAQLSSIDQNPIKIISDREFYLAESEYMDQAVHILSGNGRAVIEAFNRQRKAKTRSDASPGDVEIISFSDIQKAKAKAGNSPDPALAELSSHLRVVGEDGEFEEFELTLQPHYGPAYASKTKTAGEVALLSTETAWLALNPDVFYVDEDEEGKEIWPITFPATSLENSEIEIEVTLDRDGTLTWPEKAKAKAKAVADNQMYYLTPLYIELCDACDDDSVKSAKGKGIATTSANVPDWFLGLKTLRIDNSGDGDGAAELTLHFQKTDNYGSKFSRNWNYAFDSRVLYSTQFPFGKRHKQNQAADGLWYDGPDVNHPGVDYSFMNMPSSLKFPVNSNEVWYQGELDYFPLLPLTGSYHRLIITEQDKNYNKFSARRTDTRVEDVWTYDMSDGQYDYLTTRIDAASHRRGNSDETMLLSGVRRVNYSTVSYATNSGSVTAQRGGFKYVFVMVHRDIY